MKQIHGCFWIQQKSVFGKQKEVLHVGEPTTPTDLVHPKKKHAKKKNNGSKRSEKYVAWKKLCLVGGFNPFEKY